MSLDRSLKTSGGLARHRNVLSRPERIERLSGKGQFDKEAGNPLGLPKVGNRKLLTGGTKKKEEEGAEATAAKAAAPVAAAAPAGKAPAGKAPAAKAPAAKGKK